MTAPGLLNGWPWDELAVEDLAPETQVRARIGWRAAQVLELVPLAVPASHADLEQAWIAAVEAIALLGLLMQYTPRSPLDEAAERLAEAALGGHAGQVVSVGAFIDGRPPKGTRSLVDIVVPDPLDGEMPIALRARCRNCILTALEQNSGGGDG